ncbi:hypothetical protein D3C86_1281000 [compost metagenome]
MRVVRALLRAMARSGLRQGGQAVLAGSVPVAASESIETNRSDLLPPGVVEDFLDWLGTADPSPRQRAARATALLLHRHGVRISALPAMRLGDVRLAGRSARLLSGAQNESEDSGLRLDEDVWMALRAHWADRGIQVEAGWNANAALLAPSEFPATKRGRAKQAQDGAGYAASGLDQLLRGTWKRFAAGRELPEIGFTPRLLARAGRPLPDAPK